MEEACVGFPCHSGRSRSLEHPQFQVEAGAASRGGEERFQTSSVGCGGLLCFFASKVTAQLDPLFDAKNPTSMKLRRSLKSRCT